MRCKPSSDCTEFFSSLTLPHHHEETIKKQIMNEISMITTIGRDVWQEVIMQFLNPMELMLLRRVSREFNFWIEVLDDELFWRNYQMMNLRLVVRGLLDSISEKYFNNYLQILVDRFDRKRVKNDFSTSYRKFILDICKDLMMERRKSVNERVYLNKKLIDEKHVKIPQKDEVIENERPLIFVEGERTVTNGLLFTYCDGVFPYDYIPTIFSNTDMKRVEIKAEKAKITVSNFPMMCFDTSSLCHTFYTNGVFVISFNKLLRSSWNEVVNSIIPSISRKPNCIYILIGLNWGVLAQDPSMAGLKYSCEGYLDEFIPNSEIIEFVNGKKFYAYIDLKPHNEKEVFTFMDSFVKLIILKDRGYNLFGKDFLAKVDEIVG